MKLVDVRVDVGLSYCLNSPKANRRFEIEATNHRFSVLDEGPHGIFINWVSVESVAVPIARHPFRLVDDVPRVDRLTVFRRNLEKGFQGSSEKV